MLTDIERFWKDIIIRTEMNNRERVLAIAYISTIAYAATAITQIVNSKKQRRAWIRDILRRRREEGTHSVLIPQLVSDGFHYRNFLRMDKESFVFLLRLVEPMLQSVDTRWRRCIPVSERLTLTLRYLATGSHVQYNYHWCNSIINNI